MANYYKDVVSNSTVSLDKNFFNDHPIWSNIKPSTVDGRSVVMIPKFYFYCGRSETDPYGKKIFISEKKLNDNFQVHPAFMFNGKEVNQFYIGRYPCSVNSRNNYHCQDTKVDEKFKSISNYGPYASIGGFTGYGLNTYYIKSYGSFHVGQSGAYDSKCNAGNGCNTNLVFTDELNSYLDSQIVPIESNFPLVDFTFNQASTASSSMVVYDSRTMANANWFLTSIYQYAAIQMLYYVENASLKTPKGNSSGKIDYVKGKETIKSEYRGIYGLWGNTWEWVNGIRFNKNILEIWNKNGTRGYISTGINFTDMIDGYPNEFLSDSDVVTVRNLTYLSLNSLFIPKPNKMNTSSTTLSNAYVYKNINPNLLTQVRIGGAFNTIDPGFLSYDFSKVATDTKDLSNTSFRPCKYA